MYGNPEGPAALMVHGGPGAGCFAKHAYDREPVDLIFQILSRPSQVFR